MDPKDIKDNSEPIYEEYDIPIILGNEEDGYDIFWMGFLKDNLSDRISEGLELNEDAYKTCYDAIEQIKEKYFPEGYHGYDVWGKNENGTYYLKSLMPNPGGGVWMYIYAHEGEPRHLDAEMRRLDLHNVDHAWQALFFEECLVEYLKHVGINVPGIRYDKKLKSFPFELPYVESSGSSDPSESLILKGLKIMHGIDAKVQGNHICIGKRKLLEKKQKDDKSFVWVNNSVSMSESIMLFSVIAKSNQLLVSIQSR